jgi:hypothetical protein
MVIFCVFPTFGIKGLGLIENAAPVFRPLKILLIPSAAFTVCLVIIPQKRDTL